MTKIIIPLYIKTKFLKFIFKFLITVGIFLVLFLKIDFQKTVIILTRIDLSLLFVAIIISILSNIIIASEQWRALLRTLECHISFRESILIKLGIAPIKGILPLKSGELFRALYLKKLHNFPFSLGILSILLILIQGVFALLCLIFIGCIFSRSNPYNLRYITLFFIVSTLLGIAFLKNIVKEDWVYNFITKIIPKSYDSIRRLDPYYKTINFKKLIPSFLYAIIVEFSELVIFYIIFRGLSVKIPIHAILIFVSLVILISNIPIALFGLGPREATIIFFLSKYATSEELLSGGILFSFVDYLLPAMLGLFFTKYLWIDLMRERTEEK